MKPFPTAPLKPSSHSRELFSRRDALTAGGAGVAAALLPGSVCCQQNPRSGTDFEAILSRMTLADKVGQLLMAYLEPATLEEKIVCYRCGSLLVWGNLKNMDALGLCELTNRAQALSLQHRELPLWLHGYSQGLGHRMGWLGHAATHSTPAAAEKAAEIFGRRWRAVGLHNLPEPTLNVPLHKTGIQMEWNTASDPKTVREFGLAVVRGATRARCGTMAQHFPRMGRRLWTATMPIPSWNSTARRSCGTISRCIASAFRRVARPSARPTWRARPWIRIRNTSRAPRGPS